VRALVVAAWVAAGCAKKAPPSGGPPDIEPPRLVASSPDSGAAGVPVAGPFSITFSEGMEPRTTGEAIALAPPVPFRRLRWSGRTVSVEPERPLDPGRVYTLFVGSGARDRHGNSMAVGATVVFSTGDTFPAGRIEGRIEARGLSAAGIYLWCYDLARHAAPDSTGRDFDAIAVTDVDGEFRVPALTVPATYRLWAFSDQNANRSFEPDRDLLVPSDTTIALTRDRPVARDVVFRIVNPTAPSIAKGAVIDSLREGEGSWWVLATADSDTTRSILAPVNNERQWEMQIPPGDWTLRAFRDFDGNRTWARGREPASAPRPIRSEPAGKFEGIELLILPTTRRP
jgi:hypothetical protein